MREYKKASSHKGDPLLNRPKFGTRPACPKRLPALTSKPGVAFVCEPESISISDWKVGTAYEFSLQVSSPRWECCQAPSALLLLMHFVAVLEAAQCS